MLRVGGVPVKCIGRCHGAGGSSRMEDKWLAQRLLDSSDAKCHFPPQWQVGVIGPTMTTSWCLQTHWKLERQVNMCTQV